MNAEIIAVGTELLIGQIANTNAQYISQRLAEAGINVYYHSVVGDNRLRLAQVLKLALERSDLIIVTGGLGPTKDDITKETVSEVCGLSLQIHKESEKRIRKFFEHINRDMAESNLKQALIPKGASILINENGTAPGCVVKSNGRTIVLLPGPPSEMKPMFERFFSDSLDRYQGTILSKYIKIFGMGESAVEEKIIDLIQSQTNPTIAPYVSEGEVVLRVTAKAMNKGTAERKLVPVIKKIQGRLGDYIYSTEGRTLQEEVISILRKKGKTISLAESCTGGIIASKLTDVPGASEVFERSVVSYSNRSKIDLLGVSAVTLEEFGAVSHETALQMAVGIRDRAKTDIGLSVTGIAGPGGGTERKPVGLVYIGLSDSKGAESFELRIPGDRSRIRMMASMHALDIIRRRFLS